MSFKVQVSRFKVQVSKFRFTFVESFKALPNFKLQTSTAKPSTKLNFKLIVLFLAIIGMSACRSHKKTVVSTPVEETAFYTSCYPIESLFVPSCKLEVSNGSQPLSLNGSIYIQQDSICYFRGKWLLFEIRGAIYDLRDWVARLSGICTSHLSPLTSFTYFCFSLLSV